ncbi:MAG: 4Fe-4S binding protein [Dehalococcoidales bacterium]|nr:4Fe-4S binding protein [Dehalococcoidales bacterium]
MRERTRLVIVIIMLLLFPVILNYLSPYVSIDGAMNGIISGSLLVFLIMFVTGIFFGRAWCAWACPIAGLNELTVIVTKKVPKVKRLIIIRYTIFTVWFGVLVAGFIIAGGIKGIDPLHLTDNAVSVDEPVKFIVYYIVLFVFFGLNIWLGKRASCHAICWMSPFLVGGFLAGKLVRLPQLRIKSNRVRCTHCKVCSGRCPMGIDVESYVESGNIGSPDCILCGKCVDGCPQKVLSFGVRR